MVGSVVACGALLVACAPWPRVHVAAGRTAGDVAACKEQLVQPGCSLAPSTSIGPLEAPIPAAVGPVSSACPAWAKDCDPRPPAKVVGDVNNLGRLVQSADDLLFSGDEQAAWAQLDQVLKVDSRYPPALFLMSQITDDPHKLLGELSEVYTPQPGETLRQIAAARLGDARWCYALARYNDIAVPRSLEVGRSLRVPPLGGRRSAPIPAATTTLPAPAVGSTPPAVASAGLSSLDVGGLPPSRPSTGSAEAGAGRGTGVSDAEQAFRLAGAAEKSGKAELAYVLHMRAFTLGHVPSGERAAVLRQELITRHKRIARVATERQDPDRAIKAWRNVLELDPQDGMASAELHKLLIRKDAPKAP
jgi:tetratricopeptide (TPR) repeat protein